MTIPDIHQKGRLICENVAKVIVGQETTLRLLLSALLSGGHVLLEDVPGTGKTKLAKSLAASLDLGFNRVQFTPDLLPGDITGINVFNRKENEFILRKGPVFTNILLADEINRATPRTQAGLLECMEERQVTIDGVRYALAPPFFVMATQNPVETAGTYPLPEAQLDRFTMKLSVGLPDKAGEMAIIDRFIDINSENDPLNKLTAVVNKDEILAMQRAVDAVYVHPLIREYIADIVLLTRQSSGVVMGASPRASLALLRSAKVHAALSGRAFLIPDDVKDLAGPVLSHRLLLSFGQQQGKDSRGKIAEILTEVPAPTEESLTS